MLSTSSSHTGDTVFCNQMMLWIYRWGDPDSILEVMRVSRACPAGMRSRDEILQKMQR